MSCAICWSVNVLVYPPLGMHHIKKLASQIMDFFHEPPSAASLLAWNTEPGPAPCTLCHRDVSHSVTL